MIIIIVLFNWDLFIFFIQHQFLRGVIGAYQCKMYC
jgi:hypothetical protein